MSFFKKKEKVQKEKKEKRQRKVPTIKVGTHRKLTIALWVLLICSIAFGIYKNFTAIDTHTIYEKEVIESKVTDTNGIESFVSAFANEYYSWQRDQASIDGRSERLKGYLTENLQLLNADMIRPDVLTTSTVQKVQIWEISQAADDSFKVIFSVNQQLTEGEQVTDILSTYNLLVHVDKNGDMVITRNPAMDRHPGTSAYKPDQPQSDGTVSAEQSAEITSFLETFFRLYPSASAEELTYYVTNDALPIVQKDYIFVEMVNPVYTMQDDQVNVAATVKYLNQETKTTQLAQYNLILEKQDNWKIVE